MKLKHRLHKFLSNHFSNLYVKKFKSLEEMHAWLDSKNCKRLCKFGLLQPSYFSPMHLSCVLDESNIHMDYIKSLNEINLEHMCNEYLQYKNVYCKCAGKYDYGYFVGVEVTQEDLYYVLMDDNKSGSLLYCAGVGGIEVIDENDVLKK